MILLVSLSIMVVAWIIFNIYHQSVTSTIPEATTIQIQPISADFDMEVIKSIKKRMTVAPLYDASSSPSAATQSAKTLNVP